MATKKRADKEADPHPWTRRLKRMKEYLEENSKTWRRNEKLLFGDAPVNSVPGLDASRSGGMNELSYAWGLVNSLKSMIYIQNPDPFITSQAKDREEAAKRLTQIVAWDMYLMNVQDHVNSLFDDVFVAGYGCMWNAAESEVYDHEDATGETVPEVASQQFCGRRVDYNDILVDPQGKLLDLSDHRYIACAFYPTIASLKEDPTFTDLPENIEEFPESSESIRKKQGPGPVPKTMPGQSKYKASESDPEYKTICVWEIWDKASKTIYYVTDNQYHLIGQMPWKPWLQIGSRVLFPATFLWFHQTTTGFYPKPVIDMIAPQLLELNQIEAMLREDSLTKWRKYAILDELVGDDWTSKITDTGAANQILKVPSDKLEAIVGQQNMPNVDLRRLIVPLENPEPPKDLPMRKALVEADIQQIIGYGPGDRGGIPKVRSAREAVMMYERQNQKTSAYSMRVEKFFGEFIAKHVLTLQQLQSINRYVRVAGQKPGLAEVFEYTPEDIYGDFIYEVIPGSTGPKTTESKRAAVMQEFQVLAPICIQQGLSVRPLLEYVSEFMGWKSVDELWRQPKLAAQLLGATIALFAQGKATPEQLLDAASKMVQAELSQAELQQLAKQLQGQQGGGAESTAPAPDSGRGDTNPLGTSAAQI